LTIRVVALTLAIVVAAGCYDELKSGRCDTDSDCSSGRTCSQEMTAGVYHRCVAADAGIGDAGGADGADATEAPTPECTDDWQCSADKPVCGAGGVCVGCVAGVGQSCATLHASTPVCGPNGACVECAASTDCASSAKPVCNLQSFTCGKCAVDADCAGRPGPDVCMAHQDGRCATEAETIYVQQATACTTTSDPASGTSATPFCGFDKAAVALSSTRRLFVIRGTVQGAAWTLQGAAGDAQISVVGQQSAVIAGGASPGIRVIASDVFIRDLTVRRSEQIGISAASGSTLRTNHVTIETNGGGGLLVDGSAFEISNTVITGNGPGMLGPITWGGVLIQSPPPNGPARLSGVSVTNNNGPGISCTGTIDGSGVLATGNSPVDIGQACGITSCGASSATCGAM
jgi:hypothetical protein